MEVDEYSLRLAAWKKKNGIGDGETNQDELRMLGEEQKNKGKSHCMMCDDVFLIREMKLVTKKIDPYTQIYEGESDYIPKSQRVRMCTKCFEEKYTSK